MTTRSIELATLAIALTFAGGCKGRTAAWESTESTNPSTSVDTVQADAAVTAWESRGQSKDKALEAIADWEAAMGCSPGTTSPETRCEAVSTGSENIELLAQLTRAHYFTADSYLRADEDAYFDYMNRAVWWGELALIAASPEFAAAMQEKGKFHEAIGLVGIEGLPAMYWYASALGKWARAKGFGVLIGQKDNIKATMARALELDPNYYHGGPHRYFGAFYAIAPSFAGGDLEKSREHYDKSLVISDYFLGTKVLMAENLATKLDDEEMFDRLIEEVLATDLSTAPEEIQAEMAVEKKKAEELKVKKGEEDWF